MQLCDIIEDFSLLSYIPLNINDVESMGRVVSRIDKCNGYVFTQINYTSTDEENNKDSSLSSNNFHDMFQCAMQDADTQWEFEHVMNIQEKYMGLYHENIPELHEGDGNGKK